MKSLFIVLPHQLLTEVRNYAPKQVFNEYYLLQMRFDSSKSK